MKMTSRFVLLLALALFSFKSIAQDIDYTWKQYNITFTLAKDFKINTNNGEEFTATGDGNMQFGVFPFSDHTVDHSNITAYTIEIAKSLELEQLDDVDVLDLNGLQGAYVEGYKEGQRVVMLGFIDPDSDTNFFSIVTFGDDDEEAEKEAVRMISSFRKK
jgi:hypothetical protein